MTQRLSIDELTRILASIHRVSGKNFTARVKIHKHQLAISLTFVEDVEDWGRKNVIGVLAKTYLKANKK